MSNEEALKELQDLLGELNIVAKATVPQSGGTSSLDAHVQHLLDRLGRCITPILTVDVIVLTPFICSQIEEITAEIEQLRNARMPLRVIKAGHIEKKLAGFAKDLKQRVDSTQVWPSIVCSPHPLVLTYSC